MPAQKLESGRRLGKQEPFVFPRLWRYRVFMDESTEKSPQRRYRWPWVVLAAVILWIVLAVVWMRVAVRHVEEQRDFSAPPASSH